MSNLEDFINKGKIGEGAFGHVYKVLNKTDNKYYALKEILEFDKNTKKEIEILSSIKHENIVKYYNSFIQKDNSFSQEEKLYIVMEYCEKGDLRNLIKSHKEKNEKIRENEIIKISLDICEGLKEIHKRNIMHRDLKPENIFISKDLKIKIGDFGISKQFEKPKQYAESKKGTINYCAPEMFLYLRYNNKVDIWALGCIIYELCTLQYCFDAPSEIGIYNQMNMQYGKINTKYYSQDLQKIIDLLLIKDYKERPDIENIYNKIKEMKDKTSNKNEIGMIIDIKENDAGKDIYFLDNYFYENSKKNDSHNGLKEMNEENVDLYIDDIKYKYKNYHKFSKGRHKILIKLKIKIKDCSKMFSGCENLINIDLTSFDTSIVTDMSEMFRACSNLTNLDLSSFNTLNVTDMNKMFNGCKNLTNINLSSFKTSKVTDMSKMFNDCENLTNLDLSSFDTSNVTNMSNMFDSCQNLININLSSFNTFKVTNMSSMFAGCANLAKIDISSFKTDNVTNMSEMFIFCLNLTNLDLSSLDTSNVTDMSKMFSACLNLTNINLSSFKTAKVANMSEMFIFCLNLTNLDLSSFDTSNVIDMSKMFSGCKNLTNINLSSFKTSNATNMSEMFSVCSNLANINLSSFNTSNVKNMSKMFIDCKNLTNLDLSSFNASKDKNINDMFNGCDKLKSINTKDYLINNQFNLI